MLFEPYMSTGGKGAGPPGGLKATPLLEILKRDTPPP